MYHAYFRIQENPFSLTPDPRFLFLSQRHREALAHLLYGMSERGGFVQLTGEVGTGKTTLCRSLLEQIPEDVDVALILNPRLSEVELVATICDELKIPYAPDTRSLKVLVDVLNRRLLESHARGRRTVVILDEAQNLSPDVLEQVRLLTNLETSTERLLQVVLIGQPELLTVMGRPELRQLAQRVTARYHLTPLSARETRAYVRHRLQVAGCEQKLFTRGALRSVYGISRGVPRIINVLCDRAMLGAYAEHRTRVGKRLVRRAALEVLGTPPRIRFRAAAGWVVAVLLLALFGAYAKWAPWPPDAPWWGEGKPRAGAEQTASDAAVLPAHAPAVAAAPSATASSAATAPEVASTSDLAPLQAPPAPAAQGLAAAQPPAADREPAVAQLPAATTQTSVLAQTQPVTQAPASNPEAAPAQTLQQKTENEAARQPDLGSVLASGEVKTDGETAFATLFRYWGLGYEASSSLACDRAASAGLRCFHGRGNWTILRHYGLPAVISLSETGHGDRRAVVSALDDLRVTLDFGRVQVTVPCAEVDPRWFGGFVLLWRPPPLRTRVLQTGSSGPDVLWLRSQLDRIDGSPEKEYGPQAQIFDEDLRERVRAFQRSRVLRPDGIVGEQTLMHLTTAAHESSVPLLGPPRGT